MKSLLVKSAGALLARRPPTSVAGLNLRSWSTLAGASRLAPCSSAAHFAKLSQSDPPRNAAVLKSITFVPRRFYSPAEPNAAKVEDIRKRVLKVCAAFDKINADKLTIDSHFMNDLGLDSLDHVEVIMSIEDEFGFEIPDAHAEKLLKPADIVQYVLDKKSGEE